MANNKTIMRRRTAKKLKAKKEAKELIPELLKKAKKAYKEYSTFSQERVDRIVKAMVEAGIDASQRLAKLAVEETGYGNGSFPLCSSQWSDRSGNSCHLLVMASLKQSSY